MRNCPLLQDAPSHLTYYTSSLSCSPLVPYIAELNQNVPLCEHQACGNQHSGQKHGSESIWPDLGNLDQQRRPLSHSTAYQSQEQGCRGEGRVGIKAENNNNNNSSKARASNRIHHS